MELQDFLTANKFYYSVFLVNEKRVLDDPTSRIDLINYAISAYHFAHDYLGIKTGLELLERFVNAQKHKTITRNGKPIYFDSLATRRECYRNIDTLMDMPPASWDAYVFKDEDGNEHDLMVVLFNAKLLITAFMKDEDDRHNTLTFTP